MPNNALHSQLEVLARESVIYKDPFAEEQAYEAWKKEEAKKKIRPVVRLQAKSLGYNPCSCVSFAKFESGINVGPIGLARNHPINSQIPQIGAIVVTTGSSAGHNAVVKAIDQDGIWVKEANYIPCQVGFRKIYFNSNVIRGYYL